MKEFLFQNFYLVFFVICSLIAILGDGLKYKLKMTRTQWLCYSLGIAPFFIALLLGFFGLSEPLEISTLENYFYLGLMFFFPFLILLGISAGFLIFSRGQNHEKKIIGLYLLTFISGYFVYVIIWAGIGFGGTT